MPTRYGTHRQRQELTKSIKETSEMLADPYHARGVVYKTQMKRQLEKERLQLDAISPPPLETDSRRKALINRENQLRDAMVLGNTRKGIEPMPSVRMMQENPSGSTGKHIRFEKFWKNNTIDEKGNPAPNKRGALFEWKDVKRELCQDQEPEDFDIANIETIRPDDNRVPLADQHSPRNYGLSMAAKENFDRVFLDHVPTPVEAKLAEEAAPHSWLTCQATNKKNNEICGRPTKNGKPYCFYTNHKAQFEQPEA